MPALNDATGLYNAGSAALAHGRLGDAVLFLHAAGRSEPRAADIARNLSIAEARVALARGESTEQTAAPRGGTGFPLSSSEAWLLASLLVAVGAAGMAWRWRRVSRGGRFRPWGSRVFSRSFS